MKEFKRVSCSVLQLLVRGNASLLGVDPMEPWLCVSADVCKGVLCCLQVSGKAGEVHGH